MTAVGQQRRFSGGRNMSASPPTPDVLLRCRERSKRANSGLVRSGIGAARASTWRLLGQNTINLPIGQWPSQPHGK
jgi:hypothetical protein